MLSGLSEWDEIKMPTTGFLPGVLPNQLNTCQTLFPKPLKNSTVADFWPLSNKQESYISCLVQSENIIPTINGGKASLEKMQSLPHSTLSTTIISADVSDTSLKQNRRVSLKELVSPTSKLRTEKSNMPAESDVNVSEVLLPKPGLFILDSSTPCSGVISTKRKPIKTLLLEKWLETDSSSLDQEQWKRLVSTVIFIDETAHCNLCVTPIDPYETSGITAWRCKEKCFEEYFWVGPNWLTNSPYEK